MLINTITKFQQFNLKLHH